MSNSLLMYAPQGYWNGNTFVMPPLPAIAPPTVPGTIQQPEIRGPEIGTPATVTAAGPQQLNSGGATDPSAGTGKTGSSTSQNAGQVLGALGSLAGIGLGVPGLGLAGNAIGTFAERSNMNDALAAARAANPGYSFPDLSVGQGWSAVGHNASYGLSDMFGTKSLADAFVDAAIRGVATPGVPGPAVDPQSLVDAMSRSYVGADGADGRDAGGTAAGPGDAGGIGNGGNAWAKGGPVTRNRLMGPNPPGPDDGTGKLKVGEFVVKDTAAKYYGNALLTAINERAISKTKLQALLSR